MDKSSDLEGVRGGAPFPSSFGAVSCFGILLGFFFKIGKWVFFSLYFWSDGQTLVAGTDSVSVDWGSLGYIGMLEGTERTPLFFVEWSWSHWCKRILPLFLGQSYLWKTHTVRAARFVVFGLRPSGCRLWVLLWPDSGALPAALQPSAGPLLQGHGACAFLGRGAKVHRESGVGSFRGEQLG